MRAPAASCCMAISSLRSVIAGCRRPVGGAVRAGIGRRAVEQDARPHPVAAARRAVGRSASVAALLQIERSPGSSAVAAANAASAASADAASLGVGIGEVRHQRDLGDLGQAHRGAATRRDSASAAKPSRFMPLLSFRKTRCGCSVLCAASQSICSSRCTVCHRCRREHSVEVARLEAAFEQEDRAAPAEAAHEFRFLEIEQGEAVGALQRGVDIADTVAVGIGLDDGPDPGVARRSRGRRPGWPRERRGERALRSAAACANSASPNAAHLRSAVPRKPACYKPPPPETGSGRTGCRAPQMKQ